MMNVFKKQTYKDFLEVVGSGFSVLKQGWHKLHNTAPMTATGLKVAGAALAASIFCAGVPVLGFVALATFGVSALGTLAVLLPGEIRLNKRNETKKNEAGQNVSGPRAALQHLEYTQKRINKLTASFNTAADLPQEVKDKVAALILEAAQVQEKVKIVDAQGAAVSGAKYNFTRPKKLVEVVNV